MRISRLLSAALAAALFVGVEAVAELDEPLDGTIATPEARLAGDLDDPIVEPLSDVEALPIVESPDVIEPVQIVGFEDVDDALDEPSLALEQDENDGVVALGAVAFDADGRAGRIHRVVSGDTLWDISEAYLGTAWVWPSVWHENEAIANPHRIVPGDQIWISSTEMRRLTEREAADLRANPAPSLPGFEIESQPVADGGLESIEPLTPALTPGSAEARSLSLAAAARDGKTSETGRSLHVPWREDFGFVTDEALHAASSIVGSPSVRTWLGGEDLVYLGLGEGEVEIGQDYTIFRTTHAVRDLTTDDVIGHHVNILGWARVVEVRKESSIARVKSSNSEIGRGDRVIPREIQPTTVAIRRAQKATLGQIVYLPASRTMMGMGDYVYLDRGGLHGLEVGSELEVFDGGSDVTERVRHSVVQTPDEVVARMVVVELRPTSAAAYVVTTQRELEVGDAFRSAAPNDSIASVR